MNELTTIPRTAAVLSGPPAFLVLSCKLQQKLLVNIFQWRGDRDVERLCNVRRMRWKYDHVATRQRQILKRRKINSGRVTVENQQGPRI